MTAAARRTALSAALACAVVGAAVAPPAVAASSAFPGVNGRIVYAQRVAGDYELLTVTAGGRDRVQLTDNDHDDLAPAFSPDGRSLVWWTRGNRRPGVYRLDLTAAGRPAGAPRRIVAEGIDPTWSPDGQEVAYAASGGAAFDYDVFRTDADGSGVRRLVADVDTYDVAPAWSPDGGSIAFSGGQFTENSEPSRVYVVPLDGGPARAVTGPRAEAFGPDFSPDGTRLTYAALRADGTDYEVFTQAADGRGPRTRVTDAPGELAFFPVYSPNGRQIAYRRLQGNSPSDPRILNAVVRVPASGGAATEVPGTSYRPRFAAEDYLEPGPDWGVRPR